MRGRNCTDKKDRHCDRQAYTGQEGQTRRTGIAMVRRLLVSGSCSHR